MSKPKVQIVFDEKTNRQLEIIKQAKEYYIKECRLNNGGCLEHNFMRDDTGVEMLEHVRIGVLKRATIVMIRIITGDRVESFPLEEKDE